MTYSSGNTILAADYNSFVSTVNTVIGVGSTQSGIGYGQTSLSTVAASSTVSASQWSTLLNAVRTAATHQGTSINVDGNPSAGDTIEAMDGTTSGGTSYNLSSAVTAINTNRDNVAAGQQTTVAGSSVYTRGTNWGTAGTPTIDAEFRVTFGSQNLLDAWFNTGGEIHLTFQHPNGATAQDNDWRDIFNNKIGTLKFGKDYSQRTGSSGTITTNGYINIGASYGAFFTGTNIGGGVYGANDVSVTVRFASNSIYFVVTFTDAHVATSPSTADVVSSGTGVSVGFRKSSQYSFSNPSVVGISGF
jgi:hypothetical protein